MTEIIRSLADLTGRYDAVFCDLWGCLHNGKAAFPAAVSAMRGAEGLLGAGSGMAGNGLDDGREGNIINAGNSLAKSKLPYRTGWTRRLAR